ncbi:MAG: sigma-70 family RNA polymerase sigma factor [Planctomycetes bacterium]|nr:sigma-70 family RNA polymerase sigma factor [Planctomycetota bacterium]
MKKDDKYIQQLLSSARSGSSKSMGQLAVVVWERLYPFVFRTTLNHDLTEDILQETLLAVVTQVASLRKSQRFWPWVYRVAWNKIQDSRRRSRLRSRDKVSLFRSHVNDSQAGGDSLLDAQIHAESLQQVSEVLEQLSHKHKDVLRLRYYEQLPYDRIASMTRTTPQMARVRFHRAKKCLKARLLACLV